MFGLEKPLPIVVLKPNDGPATFLVRPHKGTNKCHNCFYAGRLLQVGHFGRRGPLLLAVCFAMLALAARLVQRTILEGRVLRQQCRGAPTPVGACSNIAAQPFNKTPGTAIVILKGVVVYLTNNLTGAFHSVAVDQDPRHNT